MVAKHTNIKYAFYLIFLFKHSLHFSINDIYHNFYESNICFFKAKIFKISEKITKLNTLYIINNKIVNSHRHYHHHPVHL